jgi:hypothetical protein
MNFPTKPGGPKDKQFEFIAADVFLRRFIIELPSANLVFIALEADVFFWEAGEIGCSYSLDRAVFWSIFRTEDSMLKMARSVGFSAPQFRKVYSYSPQRLLASSSMSAFGVKRTSGETATRFEATRMTQSGQRAH